MRMDAALGPGVDGGRLLDAGGTGTDSPAPTSDGGAAAADAGPPAVDTGPVPVDAGPPAFRCGTVFEECPAGTSESVGMADCAMCIRVLTRFCSPDCSWGEWVGAQVCSARYCTEGTVAYCLDSVGLDPSDGRYYVCCDDPAGSGDWDYWKGVGVCMPGV
jgi:hypothetical protein